MEYRRLGRTDITVSAICLGTMTWGEQNSEAEAFAQMDYALDQGVTFLDTAEMYPIASRAETYGRTEEIIGNWMAARGVRDKVVVATKVTGPGTRFPYMRDGKPRLNRRHIAAAVDASLQRLKTDYIDLYQLHWPDRGLSAFGTLGYVHDPEAEETPLEETLDALNDVVRAGKARAVGRGENHVEGGRAALLDPVVGKERANADTRALRLDRPCERALDDPAALIAHPSDDLGLVEPGLR